MNPNPFRLFLLLVTLAGVAAIYYSNNAATYGYAVLAGAFFLSSCLSAVWWTGVFEKYAGNDRNLLGWILIAFCFVPVFIVFTTIKPVSVRLPSIVIAYLLGFVYFRKFAKPFLDHRYK
jgi:hypothetical protein